MDSRVGSILRQARSRRKLDLSEVEAATKIRLRYLRAIESEEWDVLPGGVYTRGFIRTYAAFLGLDGERLAADYRASEEAAPSARGPLAEPSRPQRRSPPAGWLAFAAIGLVAAIAIVAFPSGGGDGVVKPPAQPQAAQSDDRGATPKRQAPAAGVSVRLAASAEVWVCVLDAKGQHLVDGQILEAGAEEGPFRSGSFTVSFGNGEVTMLVDGREAEIPATSSPVGYSIDAAGALTVLAETERPTCT